MTDSKIIQPLGDGKKKILSPEEAMQQLDAYQPPKPEEQGSAERKSLEEMLRLKPEDVLPCAKVEWEPYIVKTSEGKKILFRYDQHVERLKGNPNKWERAPSPQELFSLLTAYYEGELDVWHSAWLKLLAKEILAGGNLYTCHFCAREEHILDTQLHVFEFLTDIKWAPNSKEFFDASPCKKQTFDITGLSPYVSYSLEQVACEINPDLVKYLFGRAFKDLPEQLQRLNFTINTPKDKLAPLVFDADTKTVAVYSQDTTARSLGVRKKK